MRTTTTIAAALLAACMAAATATAQDYMGDGYNPAPAPQQYAPVQQGYPAPQGYPQQQGYPAQQGYPQQQGYPPQQGYMPAAPAPQPAPEIFVAIEKFTNEANAPDELFQTLRSRITDNIVNTRKYKIVERQRLNSVLSERKLIDSGMTDPGTDTAPEAGKLKSAAFVIYGSVLSLGQDQSQSSVQGFSARKDTAKVEIQLRIANAETGRLLSSKTIVAERSQNRMAGEGMRTEGNFEEQALQDAMREAAKKVTDALMELTFPAKILQVNPADLLVNLTQEQTEYGAIYEVFAPGQELFDPDTGESLGSSEMFVGKIAITRPAPRFSTAAPIGLPTSVFQPGMIIRRQSEAAAQRERQMEKQRAIQNFESRF